MQGLPDPEHRAPPIDGDDGNEPTEQEEAELGSAAADRDAEMQCGDEQVGDDDDVTGADIDM